MGNTHTMAEETSYLALQYNWKQLKGMKHSNTCAHKLNHQHNSNRNGPGILQVVFCQLKNFPNHCLKLSFIFTTQTLQWNQSENIS